MLDVMVNKRRKIPVKLVDFVTEWMIFLLIFNVVKVNCATVSCTFPVGNDGHGIVTRCINGGQPEPKRK